MNRRRFLELLGMTVASTGIAYSFPSVIVPRNIAAESIESMWAIPARYAIPIGEFSNYPHGLAYLIENSGRVLTGWSTVSFKDVSREIVTIP